MASSGNHVVFRSVVLTSLVMMYMAAVWTGELLDWLLLATFTLVYLSFEMRWRAASDTSAEDRRRDHTVVRIMRILTVILLLAAAVISAQRTDWLLFGAFSLLYAAVEMRWRWPPEVAAVGPSWPRRAMRAALLGALALLVAAALLAGRPASWLGCVVTLLVYVSFEWGWARARSRAAVSADAATAAG